MPLGHIRRMRRNLVSDQPLFDILAVWQAQVFFGSDITEHGATKPANHGGADSRGKVVIARSNISRQRAEGIERCTVTMLQLFRHIGFNQVQRDMAWPLNHHLDIIFPRNFRQLAKRPEFSKLGLIIGIGHRARAQTIPQ